MVLLDNSRLAAAGLVQNYSKASLATIFVTKYKKYYQ